MQQVFEGKTGNKKVIIHAEGYNAVAVYYENESEVDKQSHHNWTADTTAIRPIVMDALDWLGIKNE